MPVKLRQWHYAQAPLPWHTVLTTLRLLHAHLRALCLRYNNLTINSDDPIPSLPQIHSLYDQIIGLQKRYIATREELAVISEEVGYFEDPDRMTWISRPDRRRYACECDEGKEEAEGRGKDVEQRSVKELSEVVSGIGAEPSSGDSSGNSSTSTRPSTPPLSSTSSYPPTPPPSPPISTSTLKPKSKHVRFADLPPRPHRNKGVNRVRTREEVDEEFQAANKPTIRTTNLQIENPRKRKRDDEDEDWVWDWDSDRVGSVRKKVKRWHARRWPEAYYEDI